MLVRTALTRALSLSGDARRSISKAALGFLRDANQTRASEPPSSPTLVVPSPSTTPSAASLDLDPDDDYGASDAASAKRAALSVIRDLESRNAVHSATMQAVERTREWRDYDSHAHFELQLLRMRYASGEAGGGGAMSAQRRAQMQAHLRVKQLEVMDEHATHAAERFVRSLTPAEADEMRAVLRRVDASTAGSAAGAQDAGGARSPGGTAFDAELRSALEELSALLPALSGRGTTS